MTTNTSTHTGICQACGRRQAVHVHTGLIAKHGYTTDYGFFNGTCGGSDKLPLELDTEVNVAIVAATRAFADGLEADAAGEILKVLIEVGPRLYKNGRAYRETKLVCRAEFEVLRSDDFDREVEAVRRNLRRRAEIARTDAGQLEDLRAKVHGQPLQERKVEAPIKRETFANYREAYARVATLKAEGFKAQQRRTRGVGFVVTYR